jgi:hypothetical protein
MKTQQYLAALTVALLPLLPVSAQTSAASVAAQSSPSIMSSGAVEVEKLAQSGVGDEVILSYIGQTQTYFSLTAADIVALKGAGVSSQAVAAMLNHDSALHSQQAAASSTSPAPSTSPTTSTPPASTTVVVTPPPAPAPQVEVIPASPGPDYIWAPGYWSWSGVVWVWTGGCWRYPVWPGHAWVGGYWSGHGHSHVWVRGHWR